MCCSNKIDFDGTSSFLIKKCFSSLVRPLNTLFSKSIAVGYFIQKWKNSTVIPVYKSGNKNYVLNYRPVSKLTNIAKLFEHIIYDKLFFLLKPCINPAQHGFASGRSTTCNLAVFTRYCINNFEQGCQIDTVYTDLCKAFDEYWYTSCVGWALGI